jgi:hypothetical protein
MTAVADMPSNPAEPMPMPPLGGEQGAEAVRALKERDRVLKLIDSGQAAMAVVDTVSDTGVRLNGRTVAEVHLLVDRPGEESYPVTRRAVVPDGEPGAEFLLRAAQHGVLNQARRRIPVLVDPVQPDNVLLRSDLRVAS